MMKDKGKLVFLFDPLKQLQMPAAAEIKKVLFVTYSSETKSLLGFISFPFLKLCWEAKEHE